MFQNKIIALQNNDNHVFWMSLINKTRIHLSKSYGLIFALFVVTVYRVIFATYTIIFALLLLQTIWPRLEFAQT